MYHSMDRGKLETQTQTWSRDCTAIGGRRSIVVWDGGGCGSTTKDWGKGDNDCNHGTFCGKGVSLEWSMGKRKGYAGLGVLGRRSKLVN